MQPDHSLGDENMQMGTRSPEASRRALMLSDIALLGAIAWCVLAWRGAELLQIGSPAPGVRLTTVNGSILDLVPSAGKPMLLFFLASDCEGCLQAADAIRELQKSRPGQNLAVLAIAFGYSGSPDEIQQLLRDHGLNDVPVLLGTEQARERYSVRAFPTIYALDGAGRVLGRTVGSPSQARLRLALLDWLG